MRVLLDTNIIIHRESGRVVRNDIGILFNWLDRLKCEKCVHPLTIEEIRKHNDKNVVASFETKIQSYQTLKTIAPDTPETSNIRRKYDKTPNDQIDTSLLVEVFQNRVDLLLSEDRQIHRKAKELDISHKVFTIDKFLEKVTAENPSLVDYKVLAVRKELFGNIAIQSEFFDSFRRDYEGFDAWFNRKSDETAYICTNENQEILAFLYLKREDDRENYSDITPVFEPKKRLKIGTFKVVLNGYKLGERFLKIIFDNALQYGVDEIYVTIFDHTEEQKRLIDLLGDWGFVYHGKKGEENVYKRDFTPSVNLTNPSTTFPYISRQARKFIVPIRPEYHTELLPDSILNTESRLDFIENQPNRNALSKVYISRSILRDLQPSDVIVFYRTREAGKSAYYTSVTTTIGIVESIYTHIPNANKFIQLCRKRSVFSDEELLEHWDFKPHSRPFVVNFLYAYSFPKRLNLERLDKYGILNKDEPPRGFERLSDVAFEKLMELSNANKRLVVD